MFWDISDNTYDKRERAVETRPPAPSDVSLASLPFAGSIALLSVPPAGAALEKINTITPAIISFCKLMKTFLTGASGFIGNALLRMLLDRGDEAHLLVRKTLPHGVDLSRVKLFRGDLDDRATLREGMRGCDVVFHLAGLVRLASRDRSELDRINVEGTRHILETAASEGIRKVVYTSSIVAIGPSDGGVADEKTIRKTPFFTDYERTKTLAEEEALRAAGRCLPVVVVSPSLVFGPTDFFDRYSFNRFLSECISGKRVPIPGRGNKVINPVYIDDVARGHLLAFEKGKVGEKYILGGENIAMDALVQRVGDLLKKAPSVWHVPLPVLKGLGRIEMGLSRLSGREPRFDASSAEAYRHDWAYSSRKAIDALGYRPLSLREGLEKTAESILRGKNRPKYSEPAR